MNEFLLCIYIYPLLESGLKVESESGDFSYVLEPESESTLVRVRLILISFQS